MRTPHNTYGLRTLMFILIMIVFGLNSYAQQTVSIGDTQTKANAVLYLKATSSNQGLIIPIVTSRNSIASPGAEAGMLVFDKSDNKLYYHNGAAWVEAGGSSGGSNVNLTEGTNITITGSFPNFTISAPNVDPVVGNEVKQINSRGGLELTGAGTAASPLTIGLVQGTTTGQILVWNNATTKWELGSMTGGGSVTQVSTGTGLSGGPITTTGTISLANTAVTPGTYGSATSAAQVTVDAQGRITTASSNTFPDASATNEIQNLTTSGTGSVTTGESFPLNISGGTGVTIKEGTNVSITNAANVLTINAASAAAGVTSVATGTGLTGGPITTTGTIALANTAVTAGTYGNGTNVAQFTVDGQGRITSASNVAITPSGVTSVATGTGLSGGPITTTGTISLANTGVTAGLYGSATNVAQIAVDAQGRITSAVAVPITAGWYTAGNAGTNEFNEFVGTTDAKALSFRTNNVPRLQIGATGIFNVSGTSGTQIIMGGTTAADEAINASGAIYSGSNRAASNGVTGINSTVGVTQLGGRVGGAFYAQSTGADIKYGVQGVSDGSGTKYGVIGSGQGVGLNYGVYGNATGGTTNWAGYFASGNVAITNGLAVGGSQDFGVAGQVLTSAGPGLAPTWSTASGSGALTTVNIIPKGDGSAQVASQLFDNGTNVGVGTTTPVRKLDINGDLNLATGGSIYVNNVRVFNNTGNSNTFLGSNTGLNITANHNTFLGFETGKANTSGTYNLFVARGAGTAVTTGSYNVFVGADAGFSMLTGSLNTFLGFNAGKFATAMTSGTFLGNKAGENTTGDFNTLVGERAGQNTTTGTQNTMIGRLAGATNTTGTNLTLIGHDADVGSAALTNATAIGYNATVSASNTVVLGNGADVGVGSSNPGIETGAQRYLTVSGGTTTGAGIAAIELQGGQGSIGQPVGRMDFISNSAPGNSSIARIEVRSANSAQFRGDMIFYTKTGGTYATSTLTERMRIGDDGFVGIGRTATTNILELEGTASKTAAGSFLANSDRRIKTNIQTVPNGIETIKLLRPVIFQYTDYWRSKHPSLTNRFYYNYIAQEYQKVFPNAVQGSGEYIEGDSQEILQVDTYDAQIVSIKAIQELIDKVERLEKENAALKAQNTSLEKDLRAEIDEIKKIIGVEAKAKP